MTPKHSISFCPVCGGGLCGVRICVGSTSKTGSCEEDVIDVDGINMEAIDDDPMSDPPVQRSNATRSTKPHGLVVCDECEAIWLSPDTESKHTYPDSENARCPICCEALWGGSSHWASMLEIHELGWDHAVDPNLDFSTDEGVA